MHRSEILAIPLNGLSYLNTDQGKIPLIWSTTTKLEKHGVLKFTKWVTSNVVQLAFDVCRIIITRILKFFGNSMVTISDERNVCYFYLLNNRKKTHPNFDFSAATLVAR